MANDIIDNSNTIIFKWVIAVLALLLLGLQYRLWVGEGSLAEVAALTKKIERQTEKNVLMVQGNAGLAAEIAALKGGLDEIEARAREELGMVKPDETFYLIVDDANRQQP